MKTNLLTIIGISILISATAAFAQGVGGPGDQTGDQDKLQQQIQERTQLQTCDPENLEGTKLQTRTQTREQVRDCLPEEVLEAVKEMKQARLNYQYQLQELKKAMAAATVQERAEIRKLIRENLKDGVGTRDPIRERLQELRDTLPDHAQLMEQTKSQTRDRRGD